MGGANLAGTKPRNDLPMLILQQALELLLTVLRGTDKVLVGRLHRVDNSPAHVNGGFYPRLLPRFRLNMIDDTVMLDVGIEPSHHKLAPHTIQGKLPELLEMLAASGG